MSFERFYGPDALIDSLTNEETRRLFQGLSIARGHRTYAVCHDCRKLIRTNGFFGSIHLCITPSGAT